MDASIHVQLSFLNRKVDPVQYAKSFEIAPQGDDFDDIRAEYTAILQKQLASGNNGIVKTKYLTFTIEADSLKTARVRLTRIGLDLLGYFKTMGCVAHVRRVHETPSGNQTYFLYCGQSRNGLTLSTFRDSTLKNMPAGQWRCIIGQTDTLLSVSSRTAGAP